MFLSKQEKLNDSQFNFHDNLIHIYNINNNINLELKYADNDEPYDVLYNQQSVDQYYDRNDDIKNKIQAQHYNQSIVVNFEEYFNFGKEQKTNSYLFGSQFDLYTYNQLQLYSLSWAISDQILYFLRKTNISIGKSNKIGIKLDQIYNKNPGVQNRDLECKMIAYSYVYAILKFAGKTDLFKIKTIYIIHKNQEAKDSFEFQQKIHQHIIQLLNQIIYESQNGIVDFHSLQRFYEKRLQFCNTLQPLFIKDNIPHFSSIYGFISHIIDDYWLFQQYELLNSIVDQTESNYDTKQFKYFVILTFLIDYLVEQKNLNIYKYDMSKLEYQQKINQGLKQLLQDVSVKKSKFSNYQQQIEQYLYTPPFL